MCADRKRYSANDVAGSLPDGAGWTLPLGATVVNFSVFFRNATNVELLLFERQDDVEPMQIIKLGPAEHQTFFFWHDYVRGLRPGAQYAYRVDGPQDLHGRGFRCDRNKILIDPYALGTTTRSSIETTPSGQPTIWRPRCVASSSTFTITIDRATNLSTARQRT
jgi:glycogen operon protein